MNAREDHVLAPVKYVDTRAKQPLNSPYMGECSCGWVAWKPDMESVAFAHALHVARMTRGEADIADCTCAATNATGETGWGYRCHACSPDEDVMEP